MTRLALLSLLATAAWAQIAGPVLGWVPDGQRLQPMFGLPGAAAVGDGIDVGRGLKLITVSPRQDYVLAAAVDSGSPMVIVPGVNQRTIPGAGPNPDRIVISPRGSSAALWFAAAAHFQIVSGLPDAPSVREIDTAFLGVPVAFAVSDDGQWFAGSWNQGLYAFGPGGAVNQLTPAETGVEALAFYAGRSDLALATATRVLSVSNEAVSVLYEEGTSPVPGRRRGGSRRLNSPAGIATSFDNRWIVRAGHIGSLVVINLTAGTSAAYDCACTPEGLFGLGGSLFRLTSRSVKLFDAAAGTVSVVPPAIVNASGVATASLPADITGGVSQIPPITIGGLPASPGYKQQPAITVSLAASYSAALTGTLTLSFISSVGGDDQMIQFGNTAGGRTASFTIPAGSTQASFSGSASIPVLTGTVAGKITLTVSSVTASGGDVTPNPQPAASITTNPTVPFIQTVTFSSTSSALTVVVNGFSSSRDMTSGLFHFAPATNATIAQSDITVPLTSAFTTWYQSSASNQYGSQFTMTVPFTVQGNANQIVAVTVTLTNSKGNSNPVSPQ